MNKKITLQITGVILIAITIIQMLPVYAESDTASHATEQQERALNVLVKKADKQDANPMINDENKWGKIDDGIPPLMAASLNKTDKPVKAAAASEEKKEIEAAKTKVAAQPESVVASAKQPAKESPKNVITVNGKAMTFKDTIDMKATSYTDHPSENGWGPIDALGNPLKLGTVAVDPDVIPLGTKLFVTGYQFKHLPEGGLVATATDTGGKIKGNKIDIFLPLSQKEARKFGVQDVQVYVLD